LGEDRIRPSVYLPAQPFAPQHRFRTSAKSIAPCTCIAEKAAEKFAWWDAMCYAGLAPKSLLKVRLSAKPATPKNVRHSAPRLQLRIRIRSAKSIAPCKCIAEKAAWWAAMW